MTLTMKRCVVIVWITPWLVQGFTVTTTTTGPLAPQGHPHKNTFPVRMNQGGRRPLLFQTASPSISLSSKDTKLQSNETVVTPWDSFDYLQHWYPCVWDIDVRVDTPTQVTLFDVNYAVVRQSDGTVTAVVDQCPHRGAVLSEGRLTESGFLQCAYHGWSFNASSGACVDIPQASVVVGRKKDTMLSPSLAPPTPSFSKRACVKAIPACLHQGLLWLWPGPVRKEMPSPPSVPELDDPAFRVMAPTVRDFPMIDWTLLVSNILDPDHGLFAHQSAPFDWYVASPEHPLEIEESFDNAGWTMTSRVPAVEKIVEKSRRRANAAGIVTKDKISNNNNKKKKKKKEEGSAPYATSVFVAPSSVSLARRDRNNDTKNVACFWVCPVGTGRSRFLSVTAIKGLPFQVPRWLTHMALNGFLDQDSMLVASQQQPVLQAEALGQKRSDLFVYQSPTDKSVRLIDRFWDATVAEAPNRRTTLLQQHLWPTPDRTVVLDRKTQHLDICPDSQGAVRTCRRLRTLGIAGAAAWAALQLSTLRPNLPAVVRSVAWPIVTLTTAYLAEQVRASFYYKYTRDKLQKDLSKIPKTTWFDLSVKK